MNDAIPPCRPWRKTELRGWRGSWFTGSHELIPGWPRSRCRHDDSGNAESLHPGGRNRRHAIVETVLQPLETTVHGIQPAPPASRSSCGLLAGRGRHRVHDLVVDRAYDRLGIGIHGREGGDDRHPGAVAVVQGVADPGSSLDGLARASGPEKVGSSPADSSQEL